MTKTTSASTLSTALTVLLLATSATASNPFDWSPSISLLDGTGELNKKGFCPRVPTSPWYGTLNCANMLASSCLPDALGTQFGYDEDLHTIYAVNFTCSPYSPIKSCLTAPEPVTEGSTAFTLKNCKSDSPLQRFTYTSSGKLILQAPDNNDQNLCLGMDDMIWQQGADDPLEDPSFWRQLILLDCNASDASLLTWKVDPLPSTSNVLQDGPYPGKEEDDLEADVFANATTTNSTNNSNTTYDSAVDDAYDGVVASVSKSGGYVPDEGMY